MVKNFPFDGEKLNFYFKETRKSHFNKFSLIIKLRWIGRGRRCFELVRFRLMATPVRNFLLCKHPYLSLSSSFLSRLK